MNRSNVSSNRPRRTRSNSENGQILIVTGAALVTLVLIAALVVDLGFSWMLHREEQNAADPGAIAAARWLRDPVTGAASSNVSAMRSDACFYAQANGFFDGDPNCTAALASGDLQVHNPPISGDYSSRTDAVQVIIRSSHPSFFGRNIGQQSAVVSTDSVALYSAGNSNSASLVTLQPDCSGGAAGQISGGGTVKIFPTTPGTLGGYVHVNSPCGSSTDDVCDNGAGSSALAISGTLIAPQANVKGSCTYNGAGAAGFQCLVSSPCLDEGAIPLGDPLKNLPEPALSAFPNGVCPDGTTSTPASTSACDLKKSTGGSTDCPDVGGIGVCHLLPGVYYGGWDVKSNVKVELEPGMYILAGGGIKLSGASSIEAVTSPTGVDARVTIFSTDGPGCSTGITAQCQGSITFTANQAFRAKATNSSTCSSVTPTICPWKGILMWQDGTASNPTATVKLGGQASTIMAGTIYAPLAEVDINGGTSTTGCSGTSTASCLSVQIISYRWKIDGGALVEMPYDPAEIYQFPQRGLVE